MSNVETGDEPDPLDREIVGLEGGVRGKYADSVQERCNVVVIADDLVDFFSNQRAVNAALRFLLESGTYSLPYAIKAKK